MAGDIQHTIPRFLQKAFASRVEGRNVYVWMHRKGSAGIQVNIKNVGAQRHFYGKFGERDDLDCKITTLENSFSELVESLRRREDGSAAFDERIPKLVSHLSLRTRALRLSFGDAVKEMIEELHEYFRSTSTHEEILSSPAFHRRVKAEWIARGMTSVQADVAFSLIAPELPRLLRAAMPESVRNLDLWMEFLQTGFREAISNAHNRALSAMLEVDTDKRAETYSQLSWFVLPSRVPLILGDSVCLFETFGKRRFKGVHDPGDDLRRVYLPISSAQVLVGCRLKAAPNIDSVELVKASARCSYDFFISTDRLSGNMLSSSIGRWASVLTDGEKRTILDDLKGSLDVLLEEGAPYCGGGGD